MRDMNRVRNKIEIRLEPRQIALLVVGTLLFSGGLFAGGYYLGHQTAPVAQPEQNLATIDAATAEVAPAVEATPPSPAALGEVEFLFPSMLGSRPARKRAERAPVRIAPTVVEAPKVKAPPSAPPVVVATQAPVKPAPPKVVVASAPPAPVVPAPKPVLEVEPPEPVVANEPRPVTDIEVEPEPVKAPAAKPAVPPTIVLSAPPRPEVEPPEPAVRPASEDAPPAVAKPKYTLQVKAARTRGEVDEFVATIRGKGYKPSIILANVPGKGRVYRVRLGRFTSRAEARRFQRTYKRKTGQSDGGFVTDL